MAYFSSSTKDFIKEEDRVVRKILYLPWFLIYVILGVCGIGIVMMYSAANGSMSPWANKQIIHLGISFPIMIILACTNIRFYFKISYLIYFLSLGLVIYVELFGYRAMGAVRWLDLGYFKLQPSELMKLAIVLALARYFHKLNYNKVTKLYALIPPLLIALVPIALIIKQPDLGTGMILLLLTAGILFVAGIKIWKFIFAGVIALCSIPVAWKFMHEYQKKRVEIFMNPELDPLGAGYNIMQSKIAIGSAGFFGKGFLKGSQSQLSFLPERQTDFIFTMYSEEFGFVGAIILLCLYSYIISYGIRVALNCKNHFGRILAMGCTLLFFIHIFINIAMVMGLIPVVGVPLPLLSYGGTIMITMFISFGLILSCHLHKKTTIGSDISSFL